MQPIGKISSPFKDLVDMPIQPKGAADIEGRVIIEKKYEQGLADLEGFSHIYLLYEFHLAKREELTVVPFMDDQPRGVFATRSPLRPNHIGLSIVELVKREGNELVIRGVDVLDGTPLLDLKPYIHQFDFVEKSRSGWCSAAAEDVRQKKSDGRFT